MRVNRHHDDSARQGGAGFDYPVYYPSPAAAAAAAAAAGERGIPIGGGGGGWGGFGGGGGFVGPGAGFRLGPSIHTTTRFRLNLRLE